MRKTIILPLLSIILAAALFLGSCAKGDNPGENEKPENPETSATLIPESEMSVTTIPKAGEISSLEASLTPTPEAGEISLPEASATLTPEASVTPTLEEKDKYIITGEELDPEVVCAFNEYICGHTVSMGRFLMDRYYYFDVTGDGKPDLVTSVTHGSGIVSTGIFVYDIENRQGYQLQDRGDYDYGINSVEDGILYIKKAYFGRRNMFDGAVGKLEFVDGELRYNGPEPDVSDLPTPVVFAKPT